MNSQNTAALAGYGKLNVETSEHLALRHIHQFFLIHRQHSVCQIGCLAKLNLIHADIVNL